MSRRDKVIEIKSSHDVGIHNVSGAPRICSQSGHGITRRQEHIHITDYCRVIQAYARVRMPTNDEITGRFVPLTLVLVCPDVGLFLKSLLGKKGIE